MKRPIDDLVKLAPKSNSEDEELEDWEDEEAEGDDNNWIDEAQKRAKELAQM